MPLSFQRLFCAVLWPSFLEQSFKGCCLVLPFIKVTETLADKQDFFSEVQTPLGASAVTYGDTDLI